MLDEIKWVTRRRLEYIELMAYYRGSVSRNDVARAFGISNAAATKDLKFYRDIVPGNLLYVHSVFGFVPGESFKEVFADLSPAAVLPMIGSNLAMSGGADKGAPAFGITVDNLALPRRLPVKDVLCQITRAIHKRKKLYVRYHSLSDKGLQNRRIIEPHALVDTGIRWHIRAYNEESYDFRDFVLSRFAEAQCSNIEAESSPGYDDDWVETITLFLSPHPGLNQKQRDSLLFDFGGHDNVIEVVTRRAMIGYVLQLLGVDTSADQSLDPDKRQLVIRNREEIEAFAAWVFE